MNTLPLFADVPPGLFALAGAACLATAVAWFGIWVWRQATADRADDLLPTDLERDRRRLLRERYPTYRWFEPLVDALTARIRARNPAVLESLARDLVLVEPPPPRDPAERWQPEEYLALKQIEGGLVGVLAGCGVGVLFGPVAGVAVGVSLAVAGPRVLTGSVRSRADHYRAQVRSRLPLAVDLISLMLEANATLLQCIEAVAKENAGHPLGELFAVLADSVRRSIPQAEALRRMADLVDDPDVNELVFTLTATGQTSGLRDILRSMSGPMRTRRIQQLEQASERAKVNITFPGMVIMVGCLLIVLAIFVLPVGQAGP